MEEKGPSRRDKGVKPRSLSPAGRKEGGIDTLFQAPFTTGMTAPNRRRSDDGLSRVDAEVEGHDSRNLSRKWRARAPLHGGGIGITAAA